MSDRTGFIRKTILGGVIFIIPLGMLLIIIEKLVPAVKKIDAKVMGPFPDDSILGDVAMHLVALTIVFLLCFLLGLFAQSAAGRKFMDYLEAVILSAIPSAMMYNDAPIQGPIDPS